MNNSVDFNVRGFSGSRTSDWRFFEQELKVALTQKPRKSLKVQLLCAILPHHMTKWRMRERVGHMIWSRQPQHWDDFKGEPKSTRKHYICQLRPSSPEKHQNQEVCKVWAANSSGKMHLRGDLAISKTQAEDAPLEGTSQLTTAKMLEFSKMKLPFGRMLSWFWWLLLYAKMQKGAMTVRIGLEKFVQHPQSPTESELQCRDSCAIRWLSETLKPSETWRPGSLQSLGCKFVWEDALERGLGHFGGERKKKAEKTFFKNVEATQNETETPRKMPKWQQWQPGQGGASHGSGSLGKSKVAKSRRNASINASKMAQEARQKKKLEEEHNGGQQARLPEEHSNHEEDQMGRSSQGNVTILLCSWKSRTSIGMCMHGHTHCCVQAWCYMHTRHMRQAQEELLNHSWQS